MNEAKGLGGRSAPVIERLHQLHPKLIDLSLHRLQALLARMGHPERHLPPVVHVAGTNGKGSTCAFLRAIAEAAGQRAHVFTSPHLVRFHERIRLAGELVATGHPVSPSTVGKLLKANGYSLQANTKTIEGKQHVDRDAQFGYLNDQATAFGVTGDPVISVDTKKKELIGNFRASGREWEPKGEPTKTNVHDFVDKELGKVAPYGVYDIAANAGWVNVGTDADTGQFAVESIRRWWNTIGTDTYPTATRLLITADSGGSNGSRLRLWKTELAALATETGLAITVCHLPPGTSKWNKIEHRLFSAISRSWQAPPPDLT